MNRILNFESFSSANEKVNEGSQGKAAGDVVLVDRIPDQDFQPKKGIPYIKVNDGSVEFMKATPVDSCSLTFTSSKNEKPGLHFKQVASGGKVTEKQFFVPNQIAKNAFDILIQIYTLIYKESLQDGELDDLKSLVQSILMAAKKAGSNNDTFLDFVEGIKKTEQAEQTMKQHGRGLDEKTKSQIIDTVSAALKKLG